MASSIEEYAKRRIQGLIAQAELDGRELTSEEKAESEELLERVAEAKANERELEARRLGITPEELKQRELREQIREAAAVGNGPPSVPGAGAAGAGSSLWLAARSAGAKAAPGQIVRYETYVPAKELIIGSDPPDPDALSRREPGIEGLPHVERYIYPALPGKPIDAGTSKVEYLAQTARDLPDPAGVILPFASTDPKAEVGSTVELKQDDAQMFAVLTGYVPNALLGRDDLRAILDADAKRALNAAVEDHVVAAITADPTSATAGADLVAAIVMAQQALRDAGFSPSFTAISSSDATALALLQDAEERYQGNLIPNLGTLRISDSVSDGEPLVVDASAVGALYSGSLAVDVDGFTRFDSNESRVRFEFPGMMVTRQPGAVAIGAISGGGG